MGAATGYRGGPVDIWPALVPSNLNTFICLWAEELGEEILAKLLILAFRRRPEIEEY